jgi:TPP-dependent pyruvate/acetoin dehydrogenase alpha subunit
VLIYARKLLGSGDISQDELTAMDEQQTARIAEAREFAMDSPRPAPESALEHVFA